MKILYDIAVLGLGKTGPSARAGIYRVVESIAEQLVSHADCQILFCSTYNSVVLKDSIEYAQQKNEFSDVPFSMPSSTLKIDANIKRFELIDHIEQTEMTVTRKIPIKLQIRSLWLKEQFYSLSTSKYYFINKRDLAATDIFHSPFLPIPEQVRKSMKKSIFLTCYDLIPLLHPQYSGDSIKEVLKNILNSIDKNTWILCISAATRNDLLNYTGNKLDPGKVVVTELAASDRFYQSIEKELNKKVRKIYEIPEAQYVLSLCTLEPRKNIDQAIRAFVKIVEQEKITDLNLVLVGAKGWMFDKIFEEIKTSASVKNRIIVAGYVADEHLAALYTDALMFVYPSFYEGFGLPPLEAMKCGTPVITSNTSSLPEVVGDAGIMVSPTDLDTLCGAMLSLYKNASLREDLSRRSLERANKFSWERCTQETVDAYKLSLS